MLSKSSSSFFVKRFFDVFLSFFLISIFWWLILLLWLFATVDTKSNGFYLQERVGLLGNKFKVVKIRTMRNSLGQQSSVTIKGDHRITPFGALLRRYKLDELPQLFNVLVGHMSFVGPRPDVPGYADCLDEAERVLLLSIRPGITGPATLAYRHEELLLSQQADPQRYNDEIIYPDKVRINLNYISYWRFRDDLRYILKTVFG